MEFGFLLFGGFVRVFFIDEIGKGGYDLFLIREMYVVGMFFVIFDRGNVRKFNFFIVNWVCVKKMS